VHEIAHELLHRGDRRADTSKHVRETEAHAVAFVVCCIARYRRELSTSPVLNNKFNPFQQIVKRKHIDPVERFPHAVANHMR
jgi:hypothetical protein